VSLNERAAALSERLMAASGSERHRLAVELAWSEADRGDLGEAFRILWEPEEAPDPDHVRQRARAELQAYCGNEEAALALIADLADEAPMVRARVAASRGDWEAALRWARQAADASADGDRATAMTERAMRELGSSESGEPADTEQACEDAAKRTREAGAVRAQADAWADLCALRGARGDEEGARRAALRAVELWDDMATTLPPPLRAGFFCDVRRQAVRASSKLPKRPSPIAPAATGLRPLLASLRRLASERDLEKLLALITDAAVSLSGAERGFVLLVDERGTLEAKTVRGAESRLGKQTAAFSRSIAETVLIDGEPVITVDAVHDARVQDYMSVHQLMLKSVACLPIETRGRTWGVLYLEHRSASGRFSGTDLSMLRAFADQAAIAIETARLIGRIDAQKRDLERANEALRDANAKLEQELHGRDEVLQRTRAEIARLRGNKAQGDRWGLVGVSEGMTRVYEVLDRVAANDVPVVITGESGTGKELVARAIHQASPRADAPYVSLSCGAIPEGLLESELFGHVAGAFTGATRSRDGVFVQAQGGTLFMDEIADMPPRMQLDLLRVLQERRVRPVGATDDEAIDVRVVTASKRPLRELIDEGKLREDLYYRLAVVEIKLPPLRERRADIPLLCDHFLARIAEQRGEPRKRLSRAALQRLASHDFPGNVRELEHLMINASVFASSDTIEADELAIESVDTPSATATDVRNYRDFKDAERARILAALNAHGWNRAQAARSLGMARRTFYRRLKQHGIELPEGKG
jgi:transcriptional regulator with GAF, ATPase, and Fis domain